MSELNIKNEKYRIYYFAIVCVFVMFYIIHGFAMFNNILVDDSLKYPEYYSSEARIELGRWFLAPACALGSFYDLRAVNGFLSCVYLALTVCIIIRMFRVKKYSSVIIICLLSVSFCAVGTMMLWMYTADGYMMSYLFSIAAVYFSVFDEYEHPEYANRARFLKNKRITDGISVILLCLSCGIYQANMSVYMVAVIMLFILRSVNAYNIIAKKKRETKKHNGNISWMINKFSILLCAFILYFIIWRIVLIITGSQASGQHGTDDIFSKNSFITRIINAVPESYKNLVMFLFLGKKPTFEGVVFILAAITTVALMVYFLIVNKVYKRKKTFAAIILAIISLPLMFFYVNFVTDSSQYSGLMIMSMLIPILFSVVVIEKCLDGKKIKIIAVMMLIVFGFTSSVSDNILYLDATVAFESTMSLGTELKLRIDDAIDDNNGVMPSKIYIIGKRVEATQSRLDDDSIKSLPSNMDYLIGDSYIINFLKIQYGYSFEQIYNPPFKDTLKSMPDFPSRNSVILIEDTLVIKLSDDKDW